MVGAVSELAVTPLVEETTTPNAPTRLLDGRRARRERGRRAVIDAMMDLVQAGQIPPTAEQVAARAGVSVASVFRYFDSLDELQQETISRFFERYRSAFDIPAIGAGSLDERVDAIVRARLSLYETIEPFARLARARSIDHPHMAAIVATMRRRLAEQVRTHFAAELDALTPAVGDDAVGLLATMTSFEAWDQLHHELDRSSRQIRRAWSQGIRSVISSTRAR